tara:strand:- start:222 stop:398 length:177 start_codon:yes stop_codon:yes gene_type:complete
MLSEKYLNVVGKIAQKNPTTDAVVGYSDLIAEFTSPEESWGYNQFRTSYSYLGHLWGR